MGTSHLTNAKPHLYIHDTTLRDGEQAPGVFFRRDAKIAVAKQLSRLGVDIIEAGLVMSSEETYECVTQIAKEVGPLMEGREHIGRPATIAAFSRMIEADIQRTFDAIRHAPRHRLMVFTPVSDLHLREKLRISREECLIRVRRGIILAKTLCDDVWMGMEDSGRADPDFLLQIVDICLDLNVQTLVVADTVGSHLPNEFGALVRRLTDHAAGSSLIIGAHCHNDLGLSTANALAAIQNGARHVEVTVAGIGERAGNTALEQIVMAIESHPHAFPVSHSINTALLTQTAQMVSRLGGFPIAPNTPLVGGNAFTHESGIHQDGILKNRDMYEFVHPEQVGAVCRLVLGKQSGRHALRLRLLQLGYDEFNTNELGVLFTKFKRMAEHKVFIEDPDLIALVGRPPPLTSSDQDQQDVPTEASSVETVQA
ncbi:2-isopropylmalate synthase (Alpha-isopropylmalate synthase) (Alpha-IPM synthetase) [Dimargaris cristalligena]|uniref:2-isopropylmalate synthase n=1 Tax=Dimargaris cristalligena TaxID=215637 RepID=A0A4P9ZTM6_9FUNG|nr:2-isopropylmalate synthase (Alpha-isopropylmalate synthase) (Alpha-IPM synthetase) [Dimargaris cristalligena]RKP36835.1 pyruvate carboxyltransferase [Dimargaris cristalligena]|eukprot:RKP36835.1 pyruvate carboxyltransferase [Dimargaris cristalligena]